MTGNMMTKKKIFLTADGIINIVLGFLLLLFPFGIGDTLGMPPSNNHFYTTILGGVIFGIGIALLLERYRGESKIRGLGLAGAIAINLCGGGILIIWLIRAPFKLPFHGNLILWLIAVLVLGIGLLELVTNAWKS
jgi:hypothetical protein